MSHGLHVEETGPPDGALVVLVHGTMDRSTGFARVARRLDDRYRVLRYDRRGYARSRGLPGPHGCEAHVDDLLNLLDGRHATVVGHSSSPSNRRRNCSAACSGPPAWSAATAAEAAVVPGHHGCHGNGVSYMPTALTDSGARTEAASATLPP